MTDIHNQIDVLIKNNDIVLFMKGDKQHPRCGFSAVVVQILENLGVSYQDIDILTSEDLRQGIKDYSNWPTIPQLYIKQEFIGGCDIAREMYQNGELKTLLQKEGLIA